MGARAYGPFGAPPRTARGGRPRRPPSKPKISLKQKTFTGEGLRPVRGSAPDPAGAAPLRPALKSKTFLETKTSDGTGRHTWEGCSGGIYQNLNQKGNPTAELRSSSRLIVRL